MTIGMICHALGCELKPWWSQTLYQTQVDHLCFFMILFGLFDLVLLFVCQICHVDCETRKLKINEIYFKIQIKSPAKMLPDNTTDQDKVVRQNFRAHHGSASRSWSTCRRRCWTGERTRRLRRSRCRPQGQTLSIVIVFSFKWVPRYVKFFLKNGPIPASFSFIFVFSNKLQCLQQIYVKKCPSSIWCSDSNPRPSGNESPPIITWPGLLPSLCKVYQEYFWGWSEWFRWPSC